MLRLNRAAAAAAILLVAGCTGDAGKLTGPVNTAPEGVQPTISDAAHAGAVPGFYFLPPMVPAPSYSGTFDAALSPRVEICVLAGASCGATIATFTTTSGTGGETVTVDPAGQNYKVNWHTNQFNLDVTKTYRVSVYSGTFLLGFADVDVVSSGKELKNVNTQEFIPLVDDRTLPIKFRIETGIVAQVVVSPAADTVNVGETAQFTATLVDLHGNPVSGPTVTWSSSNPAVATIDANGVATGVAPGTVTITASIGYVSGTASLTVEQPNQPPTPANDAFDAIGNVTVPVDAPGVLANDTDPDGDALTVTAGTFATTGGGTVTLNADGSFTYLSAAGFTGSDSFTYEVSDGIATATATVTMTVATRVWYVSNAGAAPGDGRDASPFTTLKAAESASAAGETIFLLAGDGSTTGYDEGIVLKNGQSLTGQGVSANVTATLNGQTVVLLAAGSAPTVTRADAGTTIALAQNNNVQGLHVASSNGAGIAGSGIGTFTASAVSVGVLGGPAVDLENGSVSATFGSVSSSNTPGAGVRLVGVSGSGVTFQSVSVNGGANGIVVVNSPALGSVQVTGTGSAGSGGTIQNITGADGSTEGIGVYLSNARNISLAGMQLSGFDNFAIRGVNVENFSMAGTVVSGTSGTSAALDEAAIAFNELTGSASITGGSVSGGVEDNVRVVNTGGVLDRITFANTTIGANGTVDGDDGVELVAGGGAVLNATVQNSAFTSARADLFQLTLQGTASSDVVLAGNAFSNSHPAIVSGGGGVNLGGSGAGVTLTYSVTGNTFRDAVGAALSVTKGAGGGSFAGTIDGNTIGVAGVLGSGSKQGSGISHIHVGGGTTTVAVTGNQIRGYSGTQGVLLQLGDNASGGHGTSNATVTGNTLADRGPFSSFGVFARVGTAAGDLHQACWAISGNSLGGSGSSRDVRLSQGQLTTARLPGYAGANNDNTAVQTFVSGNNGGALVQASNTVASGGGGFVGGAACPTP